MQDLPCGDRDGDCLRMTPLLMKVTSDVLPSFVNLDNHLWDDCIWVNRSKKLDAFVLAVFDGSLCRNRPIR